MSGLLILRALLFAGECFLASLLLPVLGFAVTALLRRRAALRHLVWTTMFGVLAVLPAVALLLPARRIVQHVAAPLPMLAPVATLPVMAAPPPPLLTLENMVLLLAALWLAGLAWQMLRMALGGIGLLRLRRASAPFIGYLGAMDIGTGCEVRLSRAEDGPSTFGILRPVVLLPRAAAGWPMARLEAVLRHEAAHVARRDAASQFLARLVCAVYWLNPLLWLAYRALRRDAEIAADDAVLASGLTPSAYAAALVQLAAESQGVAPGIAMARPPLAQRVEAVLAENSSRKGVSRMDMAKTVSFGLAATLLLGAARFDIAMAQDAPAPLVQTDAVQEKLLRAEAGKAAVDATRALASVEAARKAAQDVASTQIRRAMTRAGSPDDAIAATRALAAMEQAERAAKDVASARVGEAMRLAQAAPAPSHASASSSQESESTTNGVTTTRRSHQGDGGDDNAASLSRQDAQLRAEGARLQAMRAMADAHIDQQVAKAMADAHISETIAKALADAHVDAVTRKAIADAHIEQRIVEAMARAQPQIDAAARAARTIPAPPAIPPVPPLPAPPAPRAAPMPPVPPAPVP